MTNNKDDVIRWLQGNRNYEDGLSLFLKLGKNKLLKRNLFRKSVKNEKKLVWELSKIAGKGWQDVKLPEVVPTHQLTGIHQATTAEKRGKVKVDELPDPLKQKRMLAINLHREAAAAFKQLDHTMDEGKRFKLCNKIVQHFKVIKCNWSEIDRYLETGELPTIKKTGDIKLNALEIHKQLNNTKNNLWRAKNRLKKQLEDPKANQSGIIRTKKTIEKHELALQSLQQQLDETTRETSIDKIHTAIVEGKTDKLSAKLQEKLERLTSVWRMLCSKNKSQKVILQQIKTTHHLEIAQAYREIRDAQQLFGEITTPDLKGMRYIQYLRAEEIFLKAKDHDDIKGLDIAVKALKEMRLLYNLHEADDGSIDPTKLQPHDYTVKLPKQVEDILMKAISGGKVNLSQLVPTSVIEEARIINEEKSEGN